MAELLKVVSDLNNYDMTYFFEECKKLGYVNNVSHEAMRFGSFMEERMGNFWGLEHDGKLIATAGCHEFTEVSSSAYRIQYRGCELPGTDVKKSLSRSHFNSSTFRELIPYQLEWCINVGAEDIYLTTNTDNRNHRAMQLIAKQGFLELHSVEQLFKKEQAIWKFNVDKYITERKKIGIYTVQPPPLI